MNNDNKTLKRTKKIYNYDTKKYNKEYYVKHKEEILERMMAPCVCKLCGDTIYSSQWKRHTESNKHRKFYNLEGELLPKDELYKVKFRHVLDAYKKLFKDKADKCEELLNILISKHPFNDEDLEEYKKLHYLEIN